MRKPVRAAHAVKPLGVLRRSGALAEVLLRVDKLETVQIIDVAQAQNRNYRTLCDSIECRESSMRKCRCRLSVFGPHRHGLMLVAATFFIGMVALQATRATRAVTVPRAPAQPSLIGWEQYAAWHETWHWVPSGDEQAGCPGQ
jgi:hypothetical protein